jgi:hypothetical protein
MLCFRSGQHGAVAQGRHCSRFETKTSYSVTINVDDPSVGVTPDTTAAYALAVTDVVNEEPPAPPSVIISR